MQVYAIGHEAVAAAGSWTPGPSTTLTNLAGATPAATAALALKALVAAPAHVIVVNPDSLADTAPTLLRGGFPLVVDPSAGLDANAAAWLNAKGTTVDTVWLDGDTDTLPEPIATAVTDALAPASMTSTDNPQATTAAYY